MHFRQVWRKVMQYADVCLNISRVSGVDLVDKNQCIECKMSFKCKSTDDPPLGSWDHD